MGRLVGVAVSHVREVVSFYTMFRTKPAGRRELRVCTSLPCLLRGRRGCAGAAQGRLKIGPGETTPGGELTLTEVECLCACEMAPMAQLDEQFVGPLEGRNAGRCCQEALREPGASESTRTPNPSSPPTGRCSPRGSGTRGNLVGRLRRGRRLPRSQEGAALDDAGADHRRGLARQPARSGRGRVSNRKEVVLHPEGAAQSQSIWW